MDSFESCCPILPSTGASPDGAERNHSLLMDLSLLNPAQREAVETLSGPVLVLAGAGTGKTRVITFRMARLLKAGVAPERILSVTFTNKAAREMLERTKALLGGKLRQRPWISTFHSLCVDILRQDIGALGYPERFTILDRGDQEAMARKVLRDIRVTEKSLKPGDLLGIVSRWKSAGLGPKGASQAVEDDRELLGSIFYRKYQQALKASGCVDFDDLLLLTEQLFTTFPEILKKHQERFSHVQIDEYQDTNGIQFRIVEALAEEHRNLCVVGDDDQSIYGWRGAEVEHILNFQAHFPGAKVVRLEDNYRCTDRILDLANRLVRHNIGRHEKTLVAHKRSSDDVRLLEYPDEQTEAEAVVREIAYLIQQKQVPPADIAILFRTNEQPRLFETELRRLRLRYVLIGGQSFFDRREIRGMVDDEADGLSVRRRRARRCGWHRDRRAAACCASGVHCWPPGPTCDQCLSDAAEWAPVSAWNLMRCFEEAGVPDGTLNLVQGQPAEVGGEVASHPGIVAIGMTGSSRTGKIVAELAAGKPMLLELGGNGPTIIFDDADLDHAIARAAYGSFSNSGQICSSTERILVHGSIESEVIERLTAEAAKVRLGSPFDEDTTMGPIANEPTASKMDVHLKDALNKGAEIVFGGSRAEGFPTRLFYQPTVIRAVTPRMKLNE
jgi:hypothetical protein